MFIRYRGPSSEGVVLADGSITFPHGEAVEVPDGIGAGLVASGVFEAAKPAAKTKAQEVES